MSHKGNPRLALNNNTAGVREREEANRTREAGHLDEIQGVVASTLNGVDGVSDIEGKAAREAASKCGHRASFNGAREKRCDIDGRAEGQRSGSE